MVTKKFWMFVEKKCFSFWDYQNMQPRSWITWLKMSRKLGRKNFCIPLSSENLKEKSLSQEVRQKSYISKSRSTGWAISTLFCLRHGCWVAVQPAKDYLTLKMNITYFIINRCRIFSYSVIFSKKTVFFEKIVKNSFEGTFDRFLRKGGVLFQKLTWTCLSRIRYWIFY